MKVVGASNTRSATDNVGPPGFGASLGGQILPGAELEKVASLPTREQALSMLLGVLKAPIQKLAGTLAAPASKLVRTVAAVREQKQATGA